MSRRMEDRSKVVEVKVSGIGEDETMDGSREKGVQTERCLMNTPVKGRPSSLPKHRDTFIFFHDSCFAVSFALEDSLESGY